jgi:DNA-binding CsgD family transcriptional regulator
MLETSDLDYAAACEFKDAGSEMNQTGNVRAAFAAKAWADMQLDPKWVVGQINTFANAHRYAIFRVARSASPIPEELESTLESQVSAFVADMLSDESGDFALRAATSLVPFSWSGSSCILGGADGSELPDTIAEEIAGSRFHVFFRRCMTAEDLVLVSQSLPGARETGTEELFICQGLAQILFDSIALQISRKKTSAVRITARELECLRWCAEGKTSEEIGIILTLSTHTVNHYLISATKKLNAVNRMHAITMAIRLGILDINSDP